LDVQRTKAAQGERRGLVAPLARLKVSGPTPETGPG